MIRTDEHVRMSLRLKDAFSLRCREQMKIKPRYAVRGDRIIVKASWWKCGYFRRMLTNTSFIRFTNNEISSM